MVSSMKPCFHHENATEIQHHIYTTMTDENRNMFEIHKDKDSKKGIEIFRESITTIAKEIYKIPEVAQLYQNRKKFDLFITDVNFNEVSILHLTFSF